MSDLAAMRVLLFAGEALAASCVLMALGWLAGGAKRSSLRHLAWAASFAALLALPLFAVFAPGVVVLTFPAPVVEMTADMVAAPLPVAAPAPEGWHFGLGDAASLLIGLWIAGVVLIALRHAVAAVLLWLLRRDSIEHPFDASELPSAASRLHYDLRLSRGARGPLTWGILRPVILLPNAAALWPHDRLQAVLRHEFAHVARRDGLCQMLALAACALYWPNPLVWLGARTLRREAEIAADDAVIASGMAPSDYAGELLGMATEFRVTAISGALAMAAPSALPARVQAILAPTPQRSGVSSMDVVKMAAVALLTTGVLAAAHPSLAQDAAPVPPAPVAMATPPMPAPSPTPVAEPAAPPAPAAPATPATPPTPPSAVDAPDDIVRIVRLHDPHAARDAARMHAEMQRVERQMHDAMARMKPELARAMAEVKAHERIVRQLEIVTPHERVVRRFEITAPQVATEVKAALAEARAQLAQIDDQAIRARIDAALARAQARIDQAAAHDAQHRMVITDDSNTDTP